MPILLPDQPKPQQTSGHPIVVLLIVGFVGLIIGIMGREFGWRGSATEPQGNLALAERAFRLGDDHAAATLFRRLANKGNPTAEYWLAHMTELGLGVPRNPAKAIERYKKAARQNLVAAEIRLGEIYLYGNLVPPDPRQAKTYLGKAAYQGDARAAMLLGQMYRVGIGVAANPTKAYAWLEVANLEGNAFAKRERDISFRNLSAADQTSAIVEADEILKSIRSKVSAAQADSTMQHAAMLPTSQSG